MEKKIPIYNAKIKGADNSGILAISFVDDPAIESNFIALNRQVPVKMAIDKQKQILTGAVLIPDKLIYRNDPNMGEYYLRFSVDEIEKIALKMMRMGVALSTTTHQHEKPLRGNYLTELWIVKDPKKDKTIALGLEELPAGTLVASYKIEDAQYWQNEVVQGKVKGFSLEGIFNINNIHMEKTKKRAEQPAKKKTGVVPAFFKSLAAFLEGDTVEEADAIAEEATKDETNSGTPFLVFDLAEGDQEIWVDADGYCTMGEGGEQAPSGEHALADGNFIVIDDEGILVTTQPEADGAEPTEPNVEMAKKRGKQFLKSQNPNAARIANLEMQIEKLKKQPSATKAVPPVEGAPAKPLSRNENLARIVQTRNNN